MHYYSKVFNVWVSSAHQGCICLIKNTVKIMKYYCNLKQLFSMWIYCKMSFISVMRSWIFSIITPVFSVTWSSEIILIWFDAQETFLIIINVEKLWKLWCILFFRIHRWIESSRTVFMWIINVFTGTFDHFNASLMKKILFFKYINSGLSQ